MSIGSIYAWDDGVGGYYSAGYGPPVPTFMPPGRPPKAPNTREFIVGGDRTYQPAFWEALGHAIDEVTREHGHRVYHAMLADPIVRSSIDTLKQAAMSDGLTVMPAVSRSPASDDEKAVSDSDADLAEEVAEFVRRCFDRLNRPIDDIAYEMLDAMAVGCILAEQTYETLAVGPDKGRIALKSVRVKPEGSWSFVVDAAWNVVGIAAYVIPEPGTPIPSAREVPGANWLLPGNVRILPRDKFAILSWNPRREDPRGTSILRAAYTHWNLKVQLIPEFFKYLAQFAVPSIIGKVMEGAQPVPQPDGTEIDARQDLFNQIQNFRNAMAFVIGQGDAIEPVQIHGEGQAFLNAFDHFDRQIVSAILNQTRATMEAAHGSRADSQTGQDVLGLGIKRCRRHVSKLVHTDIVRPLVKLNYGDDVAARLTPRILVGGVEHQDQARLLTACATAWSVGMIQPDQLAAVDVMCGLPIRKPDGLMDALLMHENVRQMAQDRMSAATAGSQGTKLAVPGTPGVEKPKPIGTPLD